MTHRPSSSWWCAPSSAGEDQLTLVAAAAFFAALSLVPALATLLGIYGLVADPTQVGIQLSRSGGRARGGGFPAGTTADRAAGREWGRLSERGHYPRPQPLGRQNLRMQGLSIVFGRPDQRGMVRKYGAAELDRGHLVWRGCCRCSPSPLALASLGLPSPTLPGLGGRSRSWWSPASRAFCTAGVPSTRPVLAGVTVGSVAAALLQMAASGGFSWYVSHLGTYNETYGSLGTVVVLLVWLYLFALALLLGAEIDAVWTGIRPPSSSAPVATSEDPVSPGGS